MNEALKPCQYRQVDTSGRILCGLIKSGDREVSVNLCRACQVPQINCQHLRASMQKNVSTPLTVRFATGRVEVWDNEPPTIEFQHAACAAKTMPIHSARDCIGCPIRLPNIVPQNAIIVARRNKIVPPALLGSQVNQKVIAAMNQAASNVDQPIASRQDDSGPLSDLVKRAHAIAAQKAETSAHSTTTTHYVAREDQDAYSTASGEPPDAKSKVGQIQKWLSDQLGRKRGFDAKSTPDAEGVSEIVYAPIMPTFNEESGAERCVGWTD